MYRTSSFVCALLVLVSAGAVRSEELAPGVNFTTYQLPSPNDVFVVGFERERSEYRLEVGWPSHKRNFSSLQTVSTIAGLYDDGAAHDVLAATNGSFFASPPVIIGVAASAGEMLQQPSNQYETFFFGPTRSPEIASGIMHMAGTLTFADGATTSVSNYNTSPPPFNAITAYTPAWDSSTRSSFASPSDGVEVILEDVSYPMRAYKELAGTVTAIRTNNQSENNAIPAGGMVLTAYGATPRDVILNHTSVGDRVRVSFRAFAPAYNNANMAITGIGWILDGGLPFTSNWSVRPAPQPYNRHPRTVLAWSDTHVYMVVCDGRSAQSQGMTFQEMADFLTSTLGATDALNLDGGGSSTMVVDGTVRNNPSDGSERSVANALMLVHVPIASSFDFADAFPASGRADGWDDKFAYNAVESFSPAAPGGDGSVIVVSDSNGGVNTVRRGDFQDADYTVESDVYCQYRPGVAGNGFERVGIFVRDDGAGAFGLSTYGGGSCYAMTYDSSDGRLRAGKYVEGTLTDFLESSPMYLPETQWRRMRIDCDGSRIRYWLDGEPVVTVRDTAHASGYFGIGYHEQFSSNSLILGTRADNFEAYVVPGGILSGDFDVDGDVDQTDFGHFQACISGDHNEQTDLHCHDALLDNDDDVDAQDFAIFFNCLSGEDVPADSNCDQGV